MRYAAQGGIILALLLALNIYSYAQTPMFEVEPSQDKASLVLFKNNLDTEYLYIAMARVASPSFVEYPKPAVSGYLLPPQESILLAPLYGPGLYRVEVYFISETNKLHLLKSYNYMRDTVTIREVCTQDSGYVRAGNASAAQELYTLLYREGSARDFAQTCLQYFATNFKYDNPAAEAVRAGVIKLRPPQIDTLIATRRGICQDYAALFTSLLRQHSIPTRLVFGTLQQDTEEVSVHAWCEVWLEGSWWIYDPVFSTVLMKEQATTYRMLSYQ